MNKSTSKIKEPFLLRAIRWFYPKIEKIAPSTAHKIAWNLFFSPIRFNRPERENSVFESANQTSITVNSKEVVLFDWGTPGNPIAVVVHGWSGRATQFHKFIQPLMDKGFHVVGFDAPAHGLSEGKSTNIKEFFTVLTHIEKNMGPIKVGVGHSFGGVSLLYAIKEGLDLNTVIMISSPTIGEDIFTNFRKKINASHGTSTAIRNMVVEKFNLSFEDITACELTKVISIKNLFIIHDKNDLEVPYQNAEALHTINPLSELLLTNGLGHTRILRDKKVVDTTIQFIEKIN
ncbi:MAG: alpha/beta hydrolase [Cyclobacteriaceae bacterium]|nr:alpha/beta hydrolase [Cyclobacteriaceae bacterium]